MKEKYLLRVNGLLFRVISTATSEEYLNFFWMGGVLRDDDKAVSKTDIKIKDNGKDKGHCIGSYDSMGSLQMVIWLNDCHISTAWDKWDSEMTQSLCNYQRRPVPSAREEPRGHWNVRK